MRSATLYWALALSSLTTIRGSQTAWSSSSHGSRTGIAWEKVQSVPSIEQWALNPAGDAAVIKTSKLDVASSVLTYDLTLLAINAQYTIPPVIDGSTSQEAIYAFLSDDSFAVVKPAGEDGSTFWTLEVRYLNYTIQRDAYPPSASVAQVLGVFDLGGSPKAMAYCPNAGLLNLLLQTSEPAYQTLASVSLSRSCRSWTASERLLWPLQAHNLVVEELTVSDSVVAFTAYNSSIRAWNATRNLLFTLQHGNPDTFTQISTGMGGAVTSPAFLPDDRLVWLEQQHDGNDRSRRLLWLWEHGKARQIELDFNLSPTAVIPSKNGEALNLLTLHDQEQSLFHLWTPRDELAEPITPVRIPSDHTIHSAIHVGISALNHSHLVGVKSSITEPHELFVISHSPFEDPTDNYENIQLTDFGASVQEHHLTRGQRFYFLNHKDTNISGRVFLPEQEGSGTAHPAVFFLHGDEEGGGWHDWWMQYWNPNAFLAAGYAVIQVNPTGAEGYGDTFTQARRHQWGNQTMTDLQMGLRHALARWPIDSSNIFALGYGAFGGWAVHWLQGHNAEWGFRGFVTHDAVFSPRWWASESAAPAKTSWEFGPVSYAKDSPYHLWDPERFIDDWNTPELLIVDGNNDANVGPISQSLAAYAALKSKNVKSKLVSSTSMNIWQREIMDFLNETRG